MPTYLKFLLLLCPVLCKLHTALFVCKLHAGLVMHDLSLLVSCSPNVSVQSFDLMSCVTGHLTTDAVLASTAEVMQSTMDYLNHKYGSAAEYVKAIGITDSEVSHIRLNLMKEAAPKDLMSRLRNTG